MTPTVLVGAILVVVAVVVAGVALKEARSTADRLQLITSRVQAEVDGIEWHLQWIEPGVYFLANIGQDSVALQVEVMSSLTPVAGGPASSTTVSEPRVNPGAWLEVRHPGIGREMFDDLQQLQRDSQIADELRRRPSPLPLAEEMALAAADVSVHELSDRVEYTLVYTVSWRTENGPVRRRTGPEQRLVPSPTHV